jgi:hypothetical protein
LTGYAGQTTFLLDRIQEKHSCEDMVMKAPKHLRTCLLLCSLFVAFLSPQGFARSKSDVSSTSPQQTLKQRDGQHDFDFEIGTWKISNSGTLSPPAIGEFKNGRGEFFAQETLSGRAIYVRFVISDITPTSCRFEQSFSDDGGRTWEVNWIAIDTRVKD